MKTQLNLAASEAIRMSLASTTPSPPPAATPFTAAMTGWGIRRMVRRKLRHARGHPNALKRRRATATGRPARSAIWPTSAAGAEAAARPCDDQGAEIQVFRHIVQGVVELQRQRGIQGVQPLRAVEGVMTATWPVFSRLRTEYSPDDMAAYLLAIGAR